MYKLKARDDRQVLVARQASAGLCYREPTLWRAPHTVAHSLRCDRHADTELRAARALPNSSCTGRTRCSSSWTIVRAFRRARPSRVFDEIRLLHGCCSYEFFASDGRDAINKCISLVSRNLIKRFQSRCTIKNLKSPAEIVSNT